MRYNHKFVTVRPAPFAKPHLRCFSAALQLTLLIIWRSAHSVSHILIHASMIRLCAPLWLNCNINLCPTGEKLSFALKPHVFAGKLPNHIYCSHHYNNIIDVFVLLYKLNFVLFNRKKIRYNINVVRIFLCEHMFCLEW